MNVGTQDLGSETTGYRIGDLVLDASRREARRDGTALEVEPKVFDLLLFFARQGDRVVSKKELLEAIWTDRIVSESTLYRAIKLARDALGPVDGKGLRSVHGRGYRLLTAVEKLSAGPSAGTASADVPVPQRRNPTPWITAALLAVITLVLAVTFLRPSQRETAPPASRGPSQQVRLAVLAEFEGPGDPLLAGAVGEALRDALLRSDELSLLGAASVAALERSGEAASAWAMRVGVSRLLRARVRRTTETLLVSLELRDAANDRLLWSKNARTQSGELGLVIPGLTDEILAALDLPGPGPKAGIPPIGRPADSSAYTDFLRARHLWRQRGPDSLDQAVLLLESVISRTPNFARAHEALAAVYLVLPSWRDVEQSQAQALAFAAAREALRLDPDLGEARAILAQQARSIGDWAGADKLFREAVAREPGNATVRHWYAELLLLLGYLDRASEQAQAAVAIDPLVPMPRTVAAWAAVLRGDNAQALEQARQAIALGMMSSNIIAAWASHRVGDRAAASQYLQRVLSPSESVALTRLALERQLDAAVARRALLDDRRRDELAVIYHLVCLGLLGYPEDAPALLPEGTPGIGTAALWAEEFAPARRSAVFHSRARESGLIAFWAQSGPPARCTIAGGELDCG